MANRALERIWATGKDNVVVAGSFAPNGTSALVATSTYGTGFSVVRTSAGLYTITFSNLYPSLLSFVCTLQLAADGDQWTTAGVYSSTAGTITVRVHDASGNAVDDVAANADNRLNFIAVFKNSQVL